MRVAPVQPIYVMRNVPDSYKSSEAQLGTLDISSRLRAEQTIDNRDSRAKARPEERPIPDEPFAKAIIEAEKVQYAEEQKQIRLKTGPIYEGLPKVALREEPLVDDLYQLFLENKHIEHPELNEDRIDMRERVIGLNGAGGDLSMAPTNDDIRPLINGQQQHRPHFGDGWRETSIVWKRLGNDVQ